MRSSNAASVPFKASQRQSRQSRRRYRPRSRPPAAPASHRQHGLRAVDQRDRLFGLQHQRLDLCPLQAHPRRERAHPSRREHSPSPIRQVPDAPGSQVSAGSYASLRRHQRSDAAVQHFASRIDHDCRARRSSPWQASWRATASWREFPHGERFAHADRMRTHQVDLQFANLIAGDADIAQFADAGRDGVGDFVARDELVDDCAQPDSRLARIRREQTARRRSTATSRTASSVRSFPLMWRAFKSSPDVWVRNGLLRHCFPECLQDTFPAAAETFIFESVTMCVVSPSASSVSVSARRVRS